MHIAYIASRYPLVSHTFIVREVEALRRAGAEVDTFTVRRPSREELLTAADREVDAMTYAIVPQRPLALAGAHIAALVSAPRRYLHALRLALRERPPGLRSLTWHIFYFGEAAMLWRECKRRGIEHIHAHHANVASDLAVIACALGGRRWSWSFTLHGPTELFDVRAHRLPFKARDAAGVICISDYTRSQLIGLVDPGQWGKLRVVHCTVDASRFAADARPPRERAREILTVGRLVAAKGQALLIDALAELVRRGGDARLTIVGDGPLAAELRAQAERAGVGERVDFAGSVGQDEIRAYYARADVFALASFAEGLPVVLMEAMAMGLPVVATRIAGVPELVDDGASGIVVTPGRVDELASALASLLAQPAERRAAMGAAGRTKVAADFSPQRSAEQLLAAFSSFSAWASDPPSGLDDLSASP